MDIGIISSRYAKALFSSAKDKGMETRVYDDMKMLMESFSMEPGLKDVISNRVVPEKDKIRLLTVAAGVEICELSDRFIRLVLRHKRESLLPFITNNYIHRYRKDKKIIRVRFATAIPVSDNTREHLENKLREETGCTIEFSGYVDPALIGGFRLRVGNYRMDGSYATQLRNIRARLLDRK